MPFGVCVGVRECVAFGVCVGVVVTKCVAFGYCVLGSRDLGASSSAQDDWGKGDEWRVGV